MLKKKSIVLSLVLTLVMTLNLFGITAMAKDTKEKHVKSIYNEYECWKKLNGMSSQELRSMNFTDEDIKKIRETDFIKAFKERAKLDEKTLKNMLYTDEQIKILKNFTGTEEQIMALSGGVSLNHFLYYYYYDKAANETYAQVGYSWSWTSMPVMMLTDAIAATWQWVALDDNSINVDTYNTVRYKAKGSQGYDYMWNPPLVVNPSDLTSEFGVMDPMGNWAYSGYGAFKLIASGQVNLLPVKVAYAHTTANISPSISFDGMAGISYGTGTGEAGSDYAVYKLVDYNTRP